MYFMGDANLLEGVQYYSRCGTQKTYRPYSGAEAIDAFADRLGEYKQKRRNSVSASERTAIRSD